MYVICALKCGVCQDRPRSLITVAVGASGICARGWCEIGGGVRCRTKPGGRRAKRNMPPPRHRKSGSYIYMRQKEQDGEGPVPSNSRYFRSSPSSMCITQMRQSRCSQKAALVMRGGAACVRARARADLAINIYPLACARVHMYMQSRCM